MALEKSRFLARVHRPSLETGISDDLRDVSSSIHNLGSTAKKDCSIIRSEMANSPFQDWNFLSLHFRHQYEQGFRYLDHCGEFMVRLVRDFDFIASDAQPTGAKMNHPDLGIHLELDVRGLVLSQEEPPDHGDQFCDIVNKVAAMTSELIQPEAIFYAGFAAKLYKPFSTEEQVYAASLETRPEFDFKQTAALLLPGCRMKYRRFEFPDTTGSRNHRTSNAAVG
jgi:hypothetical protein